MDKQMKVAACVAAALFGLSACGSSGGGGVDVSNGGGFNNGRGSANNNQGTAVPAATVSGRLLNLNQDGTQRSNAAAPATSDINKITINGTTVDILPAGIHSGGLVELNADTMQRAVGGNLSYARWGYLKDSRMVGGHLVAQGQETAQMPATGTARYSGLAVHIARGGTPVQGTSQFTVDYGAKTVSGSITPQGGAAIGLNAAISGNRFEGYSSNGEVHTAGGFYGANAAEMAGVYGSSGRFSGAFGAAKQ